MKKLLCLLFLSGCAISQEQRAAGKAVVERVRPIAEGWFGFLLSRAPQAPLPEREGFAK